MRLQKKATMLILVGELERRGHSVKADGYWLEINEGHHSQYAAIVQVDKLLDLNGTPDLFEIGYHCREIEQQLEENDSYEYH